MSESKPALRDVEVDVDVTLDSGITYRLPKFSAKRDSKSRSIYVDPVSALRTYYDAAADRAGLAEHRDAALLSVLVAPVGGWEIPWVLRKYTLNKLLFYQWVRASSEGLGEAFTHDDFVAERKGPVPVHIDADLERLEERKLLRVTRHVPGSKDHVGWVIELTDGGKAAGRKFFDLAETWFRRVTISAKKDLLTLTPERLRARVHTEYPKYRRKYVELDAE